MSTECQQIFCLASLSTPGWLLHSLCCLLGTCHQAGGRLVPASVLESLLLASIDRRTRIDSVSLCSRLLPHTLPLMCQRCGVGVWLWGVGALSAVSHPRSTSYCVSPHTGPLALPP